jgi:hypothetical protein
MFFTSIVAICDPAAPSQPVIVASRSVSAHDATDATGDAPGDPDGTGLAVGDGVAAGVDEQAARTTAVVMAAAQIRSVPCRSMSEISHLLHADELAHRRAGQPRRRGGRGSCGCDGSRRAGATPVREVSVSSA